MDDARCAIAMLYDQPMHIRLSRHVRFDRSRMQNHLLISGCIGNWKKNCRPSASNPYSAC
eukprot:gene16396-biopygen17177